MSDYDVIVIGGGQERWLADNGIALLRGSGRLAGTGAVEVDGARYTADHVVLANGADPFIPPIPGLRELEAMFPRNSPRGQTGGHRWRTRSDSVRPREPSRSARGDPLAAGRSASAPAGPARRRSGGLCRCPEDHLCQRTAAALSTLASRAARSISSAVARGCET